MKNPKFTKTWAENELDIIVRTLKPADDDDDIAQERYDIAKTATTTVRQCLKYFEGADLNNTGRGFLKAIISRILDGQPLTAIREEDFDIKRDPNSIAASTTRTPRLWRDAEGAYHDDLRCCMRDISNGAMHYCHALDPVLDKIAPIAMPYDLPPKPTVIANAEEVPLMDGDEPNPDIGLIRIVSVEYPVFEFDEETGAKTMKPFVKDVGKSYKITLDQNAEPLVEEIDDLAFTDNKASYDDLMKKLEAEREAKAKVYEEASKNAKQDSNTEGASEQN